MTKGKICVLRQSNAFGTIHSLYTKLISQFETTHEVRRFDVLDRKGT